jgi:para-nitrobenzyl esterase
MGMMGMPTGAIMRLSPVVDGKYLPQHPFDPVASPMSAGVSVLVGTNRDENATFMANDPRRRRLTESELLERLRLMLGNNMDKVLNVYRKTRPNASPWDLLIGISSEGMRRSSITLAERKSAASTAPVYMYLFTYVSDFVGGLLKAGHALEIPFVFDNVDDAPVTGGRMDKYALAEQMSEAWISFARNGNPNHPGIPKWEPYTVNHRATMLFDVPCHVEIDPYREELDAWKGIELRR